MASGFTPRVPKSISCSKADIHTIFDTRRQGVEDSRDVSPAPYRPDESNLSSSFLAERGEMRPLPDSINPRNTPIPS